MHIAPNDNRYKPIVNIDNATVPLNYFNMVKLQAAEAFEYQVPGYETCIVPATGTVDVDVEGVSFAKLGNRAAEVFVAGAKYDTVREHDVVQYGSDDTKTHRKINHILGQKQHDKVGRLLLSELFTVGAGGWSGFPSHTYDTDRLPLELRHDETYNFRFRPNHGSGLQMLQREDGKPGDAYHIVDGSTICLDNGYHPCCMLPGYEIYYFTILGGLSQRPLVQFFQPSHADQIETIPGIKDMIAKFK